MWPFTELGGGTAASWRTHTGFLETGPSERSVYGNNYKPLALIRQGWPGMHTERRIYGWSLKIESGLDYPGI